MAGHLQIEIVLEIGFKLGGNKAVLGVELGGLLADVGKVFRHLAVLFQVENNHGFPYQEPVFGTAETEHIHARVCNHFTDGNVHGSSGVGNTASVYMDIASHGMHQICQGADFPNRVKCLKLGGLRYG